MKKSPLIIAAFIAASLPAVHATSVTFSGVPSARAVVVDAAGTLVTQGSLVMAGTFVTPANIHLDSSMSLAANYNTNTANAGWKQFTLDPSTGLLDTGATNNITISSIGKVGGTATDNASPQADFFNSKTVYLWIFNAATVGAATEMGIYTATTATPPWVFPTNANGVGDTVTLSTTSSGSPVIAALGGFGTTSSTRFQLTDQFNVSAVPEPGTLGAGLFVGLVGICMRPRRR